MGIALLSIFCCLFCLLSWQLRLVGTSGTSLRRACSAIFGKAGVFAAFPIWIIAGADAKLLGPRFLHRGTWGGYLQLPVRAQHGSLPLSGSQNRSAPPSPKDSFSFWRIDGLLACVTVLITQYHFSWSTVYPFSCTFNLPFISGKFS